MPNVSTNIVYGGAEKATPKRFHRTSHTLQWIVNFANIFQLWNSGATSISLL